MKRVMIVGQPGSGKSTLARELGARTGLPVHHMDHIHWMRGWQERPRDDKIAMARDIEEREAWIFEGGLSATYATRLARCDTLVVLEFPLWLRSWRVARRTWRHLGHTRPDLPDGFPEQFSLEFWQFIWRTRATGRERCRALIRQAGATTSVYHLRNAGEVGAFLAALPARALSSAGS